MATPWAPIEAPPLPPRPSSRPWRPGPAIIGLAIAIAVLLVADAAALVALTIEGGGDRVSAGDGDVRSVLVTPDQQPSPTATPLERELPGLLRFVQEQRGLRFERPVKVSLLGDDAFRARLRRAPSEDEEEPEAEERDEDPDKQERVLRAFGIIGAGVDLEKVLESFYTDSVAGYYDNKKDDLVVRGDKLSPYIRSVLVHELTHALQDQHFDIDRTALAKKDDESAIALTGLIEGDAVRIEGLYFESLPQAEQKEAEREELRAAGRRDPNIPRPLLEMIFFPYIAGPAFAEKVFAEGGQARLDEAYRHPPTTSEHLLHPDVFLAGQAAAPVTSPKADGKKLDEGVLGEFGLAITLETVVGEGAGAAARGWGGDRYVAWTKGKQTCARTTIAMDTAKDVSELRSALRRFAQERKGTTITGPAAGPVTFTTCD